jgi:hypothetical protein
VLSPGQTFLAVSMPGQPHQVYSSRQKKYHIILNIRVKIIQLFLLILSINSHVLLLLLLLLLLLFISTIII